MRLSKEGWVLNQESLASLAMPIAVMVCGKSLGLPFKRCRAAIILARHQFCSTRIGAVFALAAKPHHNNAGKEAEYNLQDHADHEICALRSAAVIVARHHAGNDTRQENDKSIHNTLNQCQRYHIAVADVRHFHALKRLRLHRGSCGRAGRY